MGNFMGDIVIIQIFYLARRCAMCRLNQRGQYGAFQAILQAAAIDGGADHGAAAGGGGLALRLFTHSVLLTLLSAEVAPILSATPAVSTAVARFLTVLLLPSSLKVLPRLPLLLTKIEAWVASDRKAAFASGGGSAGDDRAAQCGGNTCAGSTGNGR